MFKQDSKFVKHIFWDPELKTCYPLYVTIENQQKIQNDKEFALKTFKQAKSVFLQSEAAKQHKQGNLLQQEQQQQPQQEKLSIIELTKKRIKKELIDDDNNNDDNDNNSTNKKFKKDTTPIKGEILSDNEVDDKSNDNKIIDMLDDDDDDDNNNNNTNNIENTITKKEVKEEINVSEFVNVQLDESINIKHNNTTNIEYHDESNEQEESTVNNFEDISDDNNGKKINQSIRSTRKRKIYDKKPIQRPRRTVTLEKQKNEKFNWSHSDTKSLIKSYGTHKTLLNQQNKKKFFWTNIVKDMTNKNIKVDKETCQTKWNSLMKTYNKCKAKLIFPTNFPYYVLMDEVFGLKKNKQINIKSTSELNTETSEHSLNVENDSNICNKKLIIDSKINNNISPRVLLLNQPISEQLKSLPLSPSTTQQINNNNNNNNNNRKISQGSQNFTLEDVERVVQNALDTKLQRIVNAFQSTIDSLKSMSNSLNIKLTNNEETVTQIKNKVQNLENELKSATVELVHNNDNKDIKNNNIDTKKTTEKVLISNQYTPDQMNKKKKIFIISRPKSMIDSSGKKKVYQQVQNVQSIRGNISTSKLKKICQLERPSTPNESPNKTITSPTSSQRQMKVIGQFLKLSKFPTACSTPVGNIKISDKVPSTQ